MEPGQSYHIYNHANGTENIFLKEGNYLFFLKQYPKYLGDVVDTYAYCLMPNHFHFLVGVKEEFELRKTFPKFQTLEKLVSKQFSNFFSAYTQSFNKAYQRRGSLFMKNFKRSPILNEHQWQETFLYIHLNPVKHGFTEKPENWKWSSWHAYENQGKTSKLNRIYYLNFFDNWTQVKELTETKKQFINTQNLE
ncbi:MAG: transposase [Algoriphagus aquaeductus]|uniref:transposase n=1 Tax=Algoriphagus aquaeductus TaxID=475299 RepID=UPI003919AE4C